MINKLKNKIKQRGFTVLESIVAIAVLSLSVSGAFAAVTQSLSQAIIAKDEIKAFYLAGEAIEIIRNKRDNNQLAKLNGSAVSWLSGIAENGSDPCYYGKTCRTDSVSTSLVQCGLAWGACPGLNQNQTTFLYNYSPTDSNNVATNFKREIQIELVQTDSFGNPREIAVTVKISWTKGVTTREFKIKEHLFNWI